MVLITCKDATGNNLAKYDLDQATDTLETLMILIAAEHGIEVEEQQLKREGAAGTWTIVTHGSKALEKLGLSGPSECIVTVSSISSAKQRLLELFSGAAVRAQLPVAASHPRDLWNDESNAQLQEKLYKEIQQRNIDESLAHALEYMPEAFGSVVMLYVDCAINGQPVKAFVDSGAQMSIMNVPTAERCGLLRLLDDRMRGIAKGVGTQKILGQLHMVPVSVDGLHIPFTFKVLESQDMDVIIGLDQLRRHQMIIDLQSNCLRIGETSVKFLGEADLPEYAKPGYSAGGEAAEAVVEGEGTAAPADTTVQSSPPAAASVAPSQPPAPSQPDSAALAGKLVEFMALTGIENSELARSLLEASGWNVEMATGLFFDDS